MELNCEIVRDLLPGYAEGMVSENTDSRIGEHLQSCADCRRVLMRLRQPVDVPVDAVSRRKAVHSRIRKRLWLPALTVLLLLLTILCGVLVCATVPVWLTSEEAVVEVKPGTEMTSIVVTPNAMEKLTISGEAENGKRAVGIVFYGYRNHLIYPERENEVAFVHGSMEGASLWYRGDCVGKPDVLLLGDGQATLSPVIAKSREAGMDMLNNRTLIYVVILAALAGTALLLAGILLRKKKWGSVLLSASVFCFCCAASCFFVSGGRLISITTMIFGPWGCLRRYIAVAVMTLLSWGTVQMGAETLRLYR